MPPEDRVQVAEVAPVTVTTRQAIRIWIGRFIVDYVETFIALLPAQIVAAFLTPEIRFSSVEQAKIVGLAVVVQLVGPALSALISAGRRSLVTAWPSIRDYLNSGFGARR